jgi:FixJ family two-component response regulator
MASRKPTFFVAIVDDDAGVRASIADLLDSDGFRARGFSSAEQFLRSRLGRRAGCLILDMQLPGMSGLELQRVLRAQGSTIPVILVTAACASVPAPRAPHDRTATLAILAKPFDPKQLRRLVRSVAARSVSKAHKRP